MRRKAKSGLVPRLLILMVVLTGAVFAQEQHERTLDEIKAEAIHRAENGMYPLIGLDPADVREALASIKTRDKDGWAAAFMSVADRYFNEAKALEKTDPVKANADYTPAMKFIADALEQNGIDNGLLLQDGRAGRCGWRHHNRPIRYPIFPCPFGPNLTFKRQRRLLRVLKDVAVRLDCSIAICAPISFR